jgi:hypothetical protein
MNLKSPIEEKNNDMLTYKVDLDYESFLFDEFYQEDSASSKKIISEFEYVFFLINKETCRLKNVVQYEKKYLDNLLSLGFYVPDFEPTAKNYEYWWSHRHDLNIEKVCNSKLTSAYIGKENDLGFFHGAIVENSIELKNHIEKYPSIKKWILKAADSFSGIGHYQFEQDDLREDKIKAVLKKKMLLEPVYTRAFDLGATFVVEDGVVKDFFMVENYNSTAGRFRGGVGASDVDKFKKYIQEKYKYDLSEYEKIVKEIAQKYLELGARFNIQIDSFVYIEGEKLKLYPLVEVNYRKTMGLVINSLAQTFYEAKAVEWLLFTQKELKDLKLNDSFVRVSPKQNHFQTFIHPIY